MGTGISSKEREMKCLHCRGEMRRRVTPFHVDRSGVHVLLDAIPAWVCVQCGEPFFEEKEVDAIQDLVKTLELKAQVLTLSE